MSDAIILTPTEIALYYSVRAPKLKRQKGEWRGACPIHQGTNDNFAVDPKTGRWFCHSGCSRGGDVFSLEAELHGGDFKNAKAEVFRIVGRPESNGNNRRIADTYDYTDEQGRLLFQVVRYYPKGFRQRQPDGDGWKWSIRGVRPALYRLPQLLKRQNEPLFICEGEKDVHTFESLGLLATCNPMGAGKWRTAYTDTLRPRQGQVVIVPDNDDPGRKHALMVAADLLRANCQVHILELPRGKDISEWKAAGGTLDELRNLVKTNPALTPDTLNEQRTRWGLADQEQPQGREKHVRVNGSERGSPAEAVDDWPVPLTLTLEDVVKTFRKWLYMPDASALKVVLAAVAANLMRGDPLWLLLVGATGSGKTELIDALRALPSMHPVGTLTEAALLSGSPQRDKARDASGGLLRTMGSFGILLLKDFTTVLSMGGEIRAPLLAALREIHDGHWTRHIGMDGGRTLSWQGKCALIGGCTPAIDQHHALMAIMGERFIFFRMPPMNEQEQADRAMLHVSREETMRRELREAVAGLFRSINLEPREFDEDARRRVAALSTFVAHARSAVERDRYHREIDLIPASEMPGRLARTLRCLFQGMQIIGVVDSECWTLVIQAGLDCIPDVRRRALGCLVAADKRLDTSSIADDLAYPTTTTRRALEDLTGHRLVRRSGAASGTSHTWTISNLSKQLLARAGVSPDDLSRNSSREQEEPFPQ
jgi:hypothetical protein